MVSGAGGMIGSALLPALADRGHDVTRLVRRRAREGEVQWDPAAGRLEADELRDVDAAVHLSGETLDGRWTKAKKRRILDSRLDSTTLLAETLGRLERAKVLVCASAVGYYGDGGDRELTEADPSGEGFLAAVVRQWEEAAEPARRAGVRVVNTRFGVILSPDGGALKKMLLPFRLGIGGPFGRGRQYMSWIAIDDVVGVILRALEMDDLSGPVNAMAPNPVTNREFARTLGRVLGRPAVLPVPAPALRLVIGEFAQEGLLWGQRAVPARLLESGYAFRHPELEGALRHLLDKP
jgi:uncharacterized protein (TIGR01777 family)